MLAGLRCVDLVTIFDEPDAAALLESLRPDVYVKGADYGPGGRPLPEAELADRLGIQVALIVWSTDARPARWSKRFAEAGPPREPFQLLGAVGLLFIGNLISRLLGLVREQVIAAFFGEQAATTAFTTARDRADDVLRSGDRGRGERRAGPVLSGYCDADDDDLGRGRRDPPVGAALVLGVLVTILIVGAVPVTALLG